MPKKEVLNTHRAHVLYTGRVQGIGFRYTAEHLALDLGLVGWVMNCPDNRVEIICEGTKEKIELFLERIRQSSLGPYIKKTVCDWEAPTNEFKDFSVKFYL